MPGGMDIEFDGDGFTEPIIFDMKNKYTYEKSLKSQQIINSKTIILKCNG